MYPNPIFTGSSWCFLSVVRVSYFRAPFGVGALTTIPMTKLKKRKNQGQTTKPPPRQKQRQKTNTTHRSRHHTTKPTLRQSKGYPVGYTNRVGYRYERNAVPRPIPHFIPTTSGVITCMSVTISLALYFPIYPYEISSYGV